MKLATLGLISIILSTSLSASCQKKDVNELKYMSKSELIAEYKSEKSLALESVNNAVSYGEKALELAKAGVFSSLDRYKKKSDIEIKNSECHSNNQELIGRVLKVDFGVTPSGEPISKSSATPK